MSLARRIGFVAALTGPACDGRVASPVPGDGGVSVDGSSVDAATAGRACVSDVDCNDDPAVSSLLGSCFEGLCICRDGAQVQPSGRCGRDDAPACVEQGGRCRQDPAVCADGELEGDYAANMSCGDFVAAVCCHGAKDCKGAVDLVCCGASTTPYEPRCVNGWKTCDSGAPKPARRAEGCL
jgi:hypothetical protein